MGEYHMHWNYRVMKHVDRNPDWVPNVGGQDETWFGIHEVYYDAEENVQSYSLHAQAVVGESLDVTKDILQKMLEACEKPVLDYVNVPKIQDQPESH